MGKQSSETEVQPLHPRQARKRGRLGRPEARWGHGEGETFHVAFFSTFLFLKYLDVIPMKELETQIMDSFK